MSRHEEHRIQSAVVKWAQIYAKQNPALKLLFAIPNGGARDAVTGAMLKAEGVRPGVPDLFLPQPVEPFHGLFIEVKTLTGKVSPEQREWLLRLNNRGYAAVLCRGFDHTINTLTRYLAGQLTPDDLGTHTNPNQNTK